MAEEASFDIGSAVDSIAGEMGLDKNSEDRPPEVVAGEEAAAGTEGKPAAEGAPAGAKDEAGSAVPTAEGAPVVAAKGAVPGTEVAPDTWTAEAKAKWEGLDPQLKAEIVKREGDFARGIGQYKQGAEIGARLANTVQPYLPLYQKQGWDFWQVLPGILNAHQVMVGGTPEQKVEIFRLLAQDAGIDVSALGTEGTAAATSEMAQMRQEIQRLQAGVTGVASANQAVRVAEAERGVVAFSQDTKTHPYFNEVVDSMTQLITTGAAKDLKDAYEKAVWTNPVTRAKEIARANGEAVTKAAQEAADKVDKARKAKANHVQSSEGGREDGVLGSIDDTLREAWHRMNGAG